MTFTEWMQEVCRQCYDEPCYRVVWRDCSVKEFFTEYDKGSTPGDAIDNLFDMMMSA